MNQHNIELIANKLFKENKGILAADESNQKLRNTFEKLNIDFTYNNRRDYRELLLNTKCISENISGVILFDETIKQKTKAGQLFTDLLNKEKVLIGIKVDEGTLEFKKDSKELVTDGINDLDNRCREYNRLGATFTKWRAAFPISNTTPTDQCIDINVNLLSEFAKISQANYLVPIVEPDVLMEGSHTIDDCFNITLDIQKKLFIKLIEKDVNLKATILKCNMILPSNDGRNSASSNEIAQKTLDCLSISIPSQLPGIVLLSGGQSDIDSTKNLNQISKLNKKNNNITYSYGRALKNSALKKWGGKKENYKLAQKIFNHRVKMNNLAVRGKWNEKKETEF